MQFLTLAATTLPSALALALAAPSPQSATAPTTFPSTIQSAIQSFEGQVQTVIRDNAQNIADEQTIITDYSSTGRAFDFYLRNNFLLAGPSACPQADAPLPTRAATSDERIAYLQQTQLALIAVSQDAINDDFEQGVYDFCEVIRLYGGAARDF